MVGLFLMCLGASGLTVMGWEDEEQHSSSLSAVGYHFFYSVWDDVVFGLCQCKEDGFVRRGETIPKY